MLDRVFALKAHGTTVRTEVFAGFTTFLTMVYIVVVNPAIMGDAGMPVAAVAVATCVAAGFGSILMGLMSNYPLALAPGMGLNAYFTYTVVKGLGVPWETALGCVFLSGLAFLVLTVVGVRQMIVAAIPRSLYAAVAGGIGLFIAFIGLKNAGIIVADPATSVTLGDLTKPTAALALTGLALIAGLQAWKVKGAILIGILVTAAAGWALGLAHATPAAYSLRDLSATAFRVDVPGALNLRGGLGVALAEIVFVFLFVDLFDNVGTLVAVTKKAGLVDAEGSIPRLNRVLLADSIASMIGALAGTSTVTSYIESASGVAVGGRTGLTSVVPLFRPTGSGDPDGGHGAGADSGGRPDDRGGGRGGLDRSDCRRPGLPHRDRYSAHLFHRQRPCIRHHQLRCPDAGYGQGAAEGLAHVCPRRPLRRPFHLSGPWLAEPASPSVWPRLFSS